MGARAARRSRLHDAVAQPEHIVGKALHAVEHETAGRGAVPRHVEEGRSPTRPSATGATSRLTSSTSPSRKKLPLIPPPPSSMSVWTPSRAPIFCSATARSRSSRPASRYDTPRSRSVARYSSGTRSESTATTWSPATSPDSHTSLPRGSTAMANDTCSPAAPGATKSARGGPSYVRATSASDLVLAAKCCSIVTRPQSHASGAYEACTSSYCRRPSLESGQPSTSMRPSTEVSMWQITRGRPAARGASSSVFRTWVLTVSLRKTRPAHYRDRAPWAGRPARPRDPGGCTRTRSRTSRRTRPQCPCRTASDLRC